MGIRFGAIWATGLATLGLCGCSGRTLTDGSQGAGHVGDGGGAEPGKGGSGGATSNMPGVGGRAGAGNTNGEAMGEPSKIDGGVSGAGGVSGTGGIHAGGSRNGDGGASGAAGQGGGSYVCSERPSADPGGSGVLNSRCCSATGGCADPATLTGDAVKSFGHDTCSAALVCAPSAPAAAPAKCTSHVVTNAPEGVEGRCISRCFLLGNSFSSALDDAGTCPAGQVCAPCYAPDGKSSGACNTGTDKPVKPAQAAYAACPSDNDAGQSGGGLCVPARLLERFSEPANPLYNPEIAVLGQASCAADEKCMPAAKAVNPGYCAVHCRTATTIAQLDPLYANGACTPEFFVLYQTGTTGVTLYGGPGGTACARGELCYPCADPLTNGSPTGACY